MYGIIRGRRQHSGAICLALFVCAAGCSATHQNFAPAYVVSRPPEGCDQGTRRTPIQTASFTDDGEDEPSDLPAPPSDDGLLETSEKPPEPFLVDTPDPAGEELDDLSEAEPLLLEEELISLVQAQNPTLQAMYAAWEAAAARYPQEVSLDDPMLDLMFAPRSFSGSSDVQESWSIEASQKFPWPGKRRLRGEIANATAHAAAMNAEDTRLQIVLAVRLAFADYASAEQLLELNSGESKLLDEMRATAKVRYETNQTPQQDVLQASVELAELKARRFELLRARQVAVARINTLLHRHPREPLPQPTTLPAPTGELPGSDELLDQAIQSRPDLAAQAAKIAAEQAAIGLALKEFYPDMDLYGRYDNFWFDPEQQASIGLKLNLPVRRNRRHAAVSEAQARLSRASAEYEARVAQIRYDVEAARERAVEAASGLHLYSGEILEAASQNSASAQAGYVTGTVSFIALIDSQRRLIEFRRKLVALTAEYHRQLAELERALGGPIPLVEPAS